MIFTVVAGCGFQASTGSRVGDLASPAANDRPITIEAGVVLVDRDGYLCLPIEQVGLPPDARVLAARSSCECVQPRMVEYINASEEPAQALFLQYLSEAEFAKQPGADASVLAIQDEFSPANLGVLIDLQLEDGSTHRFTVNLLHTRLDEEGLP